MKADTVAITEARNVKVTATTEHLGRAECGPTRIAPTPHTG